MPDLIASLQKQDLGHLHIIAGFWGLELESTELDSALEELSSSLLDLEAVAETLDILSPAARAALNALVEAGGKLEWVVFARAHGEIREMGPGKRDRELPHRKPISSAEILFYYGLLAKAFFDTAKGSQEFAYIPDDLLEAVETLGMDDLPEEPVLPRDEPLGRPATPVEKAFEIPVSDHVLDDATTYLAALRLNLESNGLLAEKQGQVLALQTLLSTSKIIKNNIPQPEAVKKFLEVSRTEALTMLHQAWLESQTFDELRMIPSIVCEGEWVNQPQVTREFLVNLIEAVPAGKWWSVTAFVKAIKDKYPDFQRPAGDYDSWFIKRASDGQFLRGFAYWDQVDGALIKYVIQTLHWLGRVDLASAEEGGAFTSFRLSPFLEKKDAQAKVIVTSNGRITVSRNFSRAARYQIARFCEWENEKPDDFIYVVTARSLQAAAGQGLKAEQLLSMLVKYTNGSIPPPMVKALKRWETNGTEARVESLLVLRVSRPEVLEEMRNSKAGKFLGEILSPTAVVVKEGAIQKVMAALAELGLLADVAVSPSVND
jgi:hypothetical protein